MARESPVMNSKLRIVLVLVLATAAVLWILGPRMARHQESESAPSPPIISPEETGTKADDLLSLSNQQANSARTSVPSAGAGSSAKAPGASKSEDALTIRGTVFDERGNPVAKFEISAWKGGALQTTGRESKSLTRAFEGESGAFKLSVPRAGEWILEARSELPPSSRVVELLQGNGLFVVPESERAIKSAPVLVQVPQGTSTASILLPNPASANGIVLAPDGSPVSEATILLRLPAESRPTFGDLDTRSVARSDESGRFTLDPVQPGGFQLLASHPPFCDSEWTNVGVSGGQTAQVTLRLQQGGRIVGHIDASMGSIADRGIGLYSFKGALGWRDARSDAEGRFVLEGVVPQKYVIELKAHETTQENESADAGASLKVSRSPSGVRKHISVQEGATTEVSFDQEDDQGSILVRGLVRCAGVPLSSYNIGASASDGRVTVERRTTTDKEGEFQLSVDGPGLYQFWISQGGSFLFVEKTVENATPCTLEFDLPGGSITGEVRNPDGATVSRAGVTLLRTAEPGEEEQKTMRDRFKVMSTDSRGRFEFTLLSPGTYVIRTPDTLGSGTPDRRVPFGRVVVPGIRVGTIAVELPTIRLLPEGFIHGRVTDARGNAAGNALVRVFDATGLSLSGSWNVSTDVNGAFDIDSIAPGSYWIGARMGEVYSPRVPVEVEVGRTSQLLLQLP